MKFSLSQDKVQSIIQTSATSTRANLRAATVWSVGQDGCRSTSSAVSFLEVPEPSTAQDQCTQKVRVIRNMSDIGPGSTGRPAMVGKPSAQMEWQGNHPAAHRCGNRDRCFHGWMGSCVQGGTDRRTLVSTGAGYTHQCAGANSRNVCSPVLFEGSDERPCTSEDGLHFCTDVCQQDGGTRSPKLTKVACQLWDWCLQR